MNAKECKEKVIKAWKEILDKYENPDVKNKKYFIYDECSLCLVIGRNIAYKCNKFVTCPMMNIDEFDGCIKFKSFKDALYSYKSYCRNRNDYTIKELYDNFAKRAEFFKKYLPILESLPEERFLPGGKYFPELNRED